MRIPWILLLGVGVAHADPRYELATNPLAVVDEDFSVSLAGVVGPHVVVRGELQLATAGLPLDQASAGVAVSARLFLDRAFSGPFVEPGLVARTSSTSCFESMVAGACDYLVGPEISAGWQWLFGSHYTAAASIGVEKFLAGEGAAEIPLVYTGALRVGYAW